MDHHCRIDAIAMNIHFVMCMLSVIPGIAGYTGMLPFSKGRMLHLAWLMNLEDGSSLSSTTSRRVTSPRTKHRKNVCLDRRRSTASSMTTYSEDAPTLVEKIGPNQRFDRKKPERLFRSVKRTEPATPVNREKPGVPRFNLGFWKKNGRIRPPVRPVRARKINWPRWESNPSRPCTGGYLCNALTNLAQLICCILCVKYSVLPLFFLFNY
jgi:hypothetical protein